MASSPSKPNPDVIAPLPPPPPHLAGSTHHVETTFSVKVSNKHGYLCHTQVDATWDVPPQDIFDIFVYPNNAALFRDVKHVGGRKIMSEEADHRVVQVEQVGEMRLLWMTRRFSTWLSVTEDRRDPGRLATLFELLSSDVLSKFNGSWELRPVEEDGQVTGCTGVLHHDVLPKGMPSFLQHVPVLGGLLRGISMRSVRRLMEDINAAVHKIKAGKAKGRTTLEVLQELCGVGPALPPTQPPPPVHSFALDDLNDEEDEGTAEGSGTPSDRRDGSSRSAVPPEATAVQQQSAAAAGDKPGGGAQSVNSHHIEVDVSTRSMDGPLVEAGGEGQSGEGQPARGAEAAGAVAAVGDSDPGTTSGTQAEAGGTAGGTPVNTASGGSA